MNSATPIVQMSNLCKRFGKVQALDKINLEVVPGKIIGLLGANGSGKSTLVRHIVGLYLVDSGTCQTFGADAAKLGPRELARIGYVHQEGELLDWMKVKQLIRYVAAYYPNWNSELEENFIGDFDLPLKARVGTLSPGKRQQLAILLAIGFDPELLILDEPASALDPIARSRFLDLLLQIIQDEQRTIIISSHILSDVEKVVDHILIMDQGRILTDAGFDDLRERFCRVRLTAIDSELPEALPWDDILTCDRTAQALLTLQTRDQLQQKAQSLNCTLDIQPVTLEDIYKIIIAQQQKTSVA